MRLIKELARTTPEQRAQLAARYPQVHGKELKKVMKSECGNKDFGTALQFLSVPSGKQQQESEGICCVVLCCVVLQRVCCDMLYQPDDMVDS
jgi:hypothetical protein